MYITNSDQAIQCDLCDSWVHIKCNDLNFMDYKFLQNSNDPWICISICYLNLTTMVFEVYQINPTFLIVNSLFL